MEAKKPDRSAPWVRVLLVAVILGVVAGILLQGAR
jgi:hypothetical protein